MPGRGVPSERGNAICPESDMDHTAGDADPPEPTLLTGAQVMAEVRDQAMFLIDLTGRLTSWNLGVGLILGWEAADWIGQPLQTVFTPEDIAAGVPQAEMRAAARTGRVDDTRWMRRQDGQRFVAFGSMTRLLDADGRHVGYLKALRDCTGEPRAAQVADSGFGCGSREALVREVSHAMRTPLSTILGWAHVLQRGSFDAGTIGRGLDAISRSAVAQVQFLDSLQTQDRLEPPPQPGHAESFAVDEVTRAGPDADGGSPTRPLDGVTVLVVDDDADVRESTARTLRQEGATVCSAACADEAFDLLQERRPDVLLSDIGMPVVDGHELIRRVRGLDPDAGGRTPAAALTAYLQPADLKRALDAGFELHLAKPAPARALVAAVLELGRKRDRPRDG